MNFNKSLYRMLNKEVIPCSYCFEKGILENGKICPTCNGSGEILLDNIR
ncbi:MAG: hypothetical protein ACOCVF_02830 [bacterium]